MTSRVRPTVEVMLQGYVYEADRPLSHRSVSRTSENDRNAVSDDGRSLKHTEAKVKNDIED